MSVKKEGGDAPALASSPTRILGEEWAEARLLFLKAHVLIAKVLQLLANMRRGATFLGASGRSSRASDRTVSTLYMLLSGAARAMGPTPKLHILFLIETCLFAAEVVSH